MSTTQLTPTTSDFYITIKKVVKEILPGQRISVLMPRAISHKSIEWDDCRNWDEIEMVESDFRPSISQPNLFVALRFDEHDETSDVVVDVCHL